MLSRLGLLKTVLARGVSVSNRLLRCPKVSNANLKHFSTKLIDQMPPKKKVEDTSDVSDASPSPPAKRKRTTAKSASSDSKKSEAVVADSPQKELPEVNSGDIVLTTFNVNGFRAAMKNGFVSEYLSNANPQPDWIFLQEIKASEKDIEPHLAELEKCGYKMFANPGGKPGYAGTAALYKSTITAVTLSKDSTCAYARYATGPFATAVEHDDALIAEIAKKTGDTVTKDMRKEMWSAAMAEGRVLTVELPDCYIVNAYVPNAGQKLERLDFRTQVWEPVMLEYLHILEAKKPVIYTGDLNVAHEDLDIHSPKTNHKSAGFTDAERARCSAMLASGLHDTFRELQGNDVHGYTFWGYRFDGRNKNRGWRLDYFLTSPLLRGRVRGVAVGSEIGADGKRISDHAPLNMLMKGAETQEEK